MTIDSFADAALQWQTEGWVLIKGLLPADEVAPALAEAQSIKHDEPKSKGAVRRADRPPEDSSEEARPSFSNAQFTGTNLFPIANAPRLNRLFVHPLLSEFAKAALVTDDPRIYQSRLWSKFGGHADYEQPLHRDQNHSLVPTRAEPGWWFLECFVYLNDVDETNGAPRLVSRSESTTEPDARTVLNADDSPEFYNAEVAACGPAGTLLAYRSDVWHRGVNLHPGSERHVVVISYKPPALDWVSFDAHGPSVNSRHFIRFASECTAEELALFGVPLPGHPFWNAETVEGMALIYPDLDLTPWRDAL